MSVEMRIMGLMLDAVVSAVFEVVAQARQARFRRLVKESGLSEDEAKRALRELRQYGLIKSSGEVDELSTFYLTSTGLEAAREKGLTR